MSDSVRPHGLQPTRLLHPWDSPDSHWRGLPFPSPKRALGKNIYYKVKTQGVEGNVSSHCAGGKGNGFDGQAEQGRKIKLEGRCQSDFLGRKNNWKARIISPFSTET